MKATSVTYSTGTKINTERVDIDAVINFDEARCVIYSKETQIIDFEIIRTYTDEDNIQLWNVMQQTLNIKTLDLQF